MSKTIGVLAEVGQERSRQNYKWGLSDHPDGTHANYMTRAEELKTLATEQALQDNITWNTILQEEVFEALSTNEPDLLREELLQVAAVAVAWVESLDRRREEYEELNPITQPEAQPE